MKVGRIIGEYGTRLTFAGYLAVNYVVNRGGNVIQSYRDDNPNVPDRND